MRTNDGRVDNLSEIDTQNAGHRGEGFLVVLEDHGYVRGDLELLLSKVGERQVLDTCEIRKCCAVLWEGAVGK